MSILNDLENDLTAAQKSQDAELVSILRLLKNAVKNVEIDKRHELNEQEVIAVLEKQAKQRQDSIVQYNAGNRPELAAKEEYELGIIKKYLPEKMSEEDVRNMVTEVIAEVGANSMADMGKVMKTVLERAAGKADSSMVSAIVKEKLA